jgi:hypothetical protein
MLGSRIKRQSTLKESVKMLPAALCLGFDVLVN